MRNLNLKTKNVRTEMSWGNGRKPTYMVIWHLTGGWEGAGLVDRKGPKSLLPPIVLFKEPGMIPSLCLPALASSLIVLGDNGCMHSVVISWVDKDVIANVHYLCDLPSWSVLLTSLSYMH